MSAAPGARPANISESLASLRLEQDAIALYDRLAAIEKDPARSEMFRTIAGNERRHAALWAARLEALGTVVPAAGRPRLRVRFIVLVARLFGTRAVAEMVRALEGDEERIYAGRPESAEAVAIAVDERAHADAWQRLKAGAPPAAEELATAIPLPERPVASPAAPAMSAAAAAATPTAAGVAPAPTPEAHGPDLGEAVRVDEARIARRAATPDEIARAERWHRGGAGTLRAVVFGASDGLVSNLSLIMGVAGANVSPSLILLSGIAGLLAGAFSMAAGEYISVQSQREVLQRQIALERAELEAIPDEEKEELVGIYRSKGLPEADARRIADHIFLDKEKALETLVREELGLDPNELGSPWSAAGGSFLAFCLGAVVPVIPYLFGGGTTILLISFGVSLVGLFTVGALVSLLTGRSTLFSGFRQVGIGAAAAIVTFIVGKLIGVAGVG